MALSKSLKQEYTSFPSVPLLMIKATRKKRKMNNAEFTEVLAEDGIDLS
jgi:hypothetical protein